MESVFTHYVLVYASCVGVRSSISLYLLTFFCVFSWLRHFCVLLWQQDRYTNLGSVGADRPRLSRAHPFHSPCEVTEADLCASQGTCWKPPGIRRRSPLSCMQTKDQVKDHLWFVPYASNWSLRLLFLMFKGFDYDTFNDYFNEHANSLGGRSVSWSTTLIETEGARRSMWWSPDISFRAIMRLAFKHWLKHL